MQKATYWSLILNPIKHDTTFILIRSHLITQISCILFNIMLLLSLLPLQIVYQHPTCHYYWDIEPCLYVGNFVSIYVWS